MDKSRQREATWLRTRRLGVRAEHCYGYGVTAEPALQASSFRNQESGQQQTPEFHFELNTTNMYCMYCIPKPLAALSILLSIALPHTFLSGKPLSKSLHHHSTGTA
jgi:hypothetical protein